MSTVKKIDFMNYDRFKRILNSVRKIEDYVNKAKEFGIDLFESDLYDATMTLECELFELAYGSEGYDWITWYLFELPELKSKEEKESYATDSDGNALIFNTDRDFWLFLEKEYVNGD